MTMSLFIALFIFICGYVAAEDGGWREWGKWDSSCSTTCGIGVKYRHRKCDNPKPAKGGKACSGPDHEITNCDTGKTCPIDGGWASWGAWECSVSCGGGKGKRHRTCTNPKPMFNGKDCQDSNMEIGACNEQLCPDVMYTLSPETAEAAKKEMKTIYFNFEKKQGDTVKLPCKSDVIDNIYTEYPGSAMSWTKNGDILKMEEERMRIDVTDLVISKLLPEDNGVYVCRVNYAPRVSQAISVAAVTVRGHKADISIHESAELKLTCNGAVLGRLYSGLKQKWTANDTLVKDFGEESPQNANIYEFLSATRNMTGIWSCHITDPATGRVWVTNTIYVQVLPPLKFYEKILANRILMFGFLFGLFLVFAAVGTYCSYVMKTAKEEARGEFERWKFVVHLEEKLAKGPPSWVYNNNTESLLAKAEQSDSESPPTDLTPSEETDD